MLDIPSLSSGAPQPNILWSCHVDTVAAHGGPQQVCVDENGIAALSDRKPGRSLGADDGVGVWLMLEMIEAGIPGLYVFHRGEEKGCLGSRWIVKNTPAVLEGIQAAIAFDRQGHSDVITHQSYGRTCSDKFAWSLANQLNAFGTLQMKPDNTGIYTDTNEYAHIVPECTNVAVGYRSNHGPNETLDLKHCELLLEATLAMDLSGLVIDRDPAVIEDDFDYKWGRSRAFSDLEEIDRIASLIERYPFDFAEALVAGGWTYQEVQDAVLDKDSVPFRTDDFDDDCPAWHMN